MEVTTSADSRNGTDDEPPGGWAEIRRRADIEVDRQIAKYEGRRWQHPDDVAALNASVSAILREEPPGVDPDLRDRLLRMPEFADLRPARLRPPRRDDHERRRRYIDAALEGEARRVAGTPEGLRNPQLSRSAWKLARFACDGEISDGDVFAVLVPAGLATGLGRREVTTTIRAALRR